MSRRNRHKINRRIQQNRKKKQDRNHRNGPGVPNEPRKEPQQEPRIIVIVVRAEPEAAAAPAESERDEHDKETLRLSRRSSRMAMAGAGLMALSVLNASWDHLAALVRFLAHLL